MCVDIVMQDSVPADLGLLCRRNRVYGYDQRTRPTLGPMVLGPLSVPRHRSTSCSGSQQVQHPLSLLLRCTPNFELTGVCCTCWTLHRAKLSFGGPSRQQQARLNLLCRLSHGLSARLSHHIQQQAIREASKRQPS